MGVAAPSTSFPEASSLLDLGRLLHLVTLLRFADLIGKFLNRPKVGGTRAVWVVPALLPVLQGLQRDSVSARKFGLAHAKSFPDRFRISKLNDRRAALVGLPADMCNSFLHACDKLLVEIRKCVGLLAHCHFSFCFAFILGSRIDDQRQLGSGAPDMLPDRRSGPAGGRFPEGMDSRSYRRLVVAG